MSFFNAENKTLIDNLRSSLSSRKSGIGQAYLRVISLALEIVFQRGKMPLFDVSRDEIDKIEKFSISVGLFYHYFSRYDPYPRKKEEIQSFQEQKNFLN